MRQIDKQAELIALVGLDGAGKTTQCRLLMQYLRSIGHEVVLFHNESLQPVKGALDAISRNRGLRDHTELLSISQWYLVAALFKWNSMSHAVSHIEKPGHYLIMDRYTYCYVAGGYGCDASHVSLVRDAFSIFPRPDLTIYLDVPPLDAFRRLRSRGTGLTELEVLRRGVRGYRALPEFGEFAIVDGCQEVDHVARDIRRVVSSTFRLEWDVNGLDSGRELER